MCNNYLLTEVFVNESSVSVVSINCTVVAIGGEVVKDSVIGNKTEGICMSHLQIRY